MDTLFIRLAAIYGYLWITTYSNENFLEVSKREWSEGLQEFDNQVLKIALEQMKKAQPLPPSLPCFYGCCLAIKKNIQAYQETLRKKSKEHTPPNPKIVQSNINEMKESLLKNSKEKKSC